MPDSAQETLCLAVLRSMLAPGMEAAPPARKAYTVSASLALVLSSIKNMSKAM